MASFSRKNAKMPTIYQDSRSWLRHENPPARYRVGGFA
jgi:hypothetical protein